jgi:RNA polymerase sigma factor (sigma-70 family)
MSASPQPQASGPDQARWFAEEVHPHDGALRAYLRNSYPEVRDLDDVVQESYVRTWRRHAARPIEYARGFLFQVARRLALDRLRRQGRSPFGAASEMALGDVREDGIDIAERACLQEEIEHLLGAIEALPRRTREVYLLRKFEGLGQREISARLGISEGTVETHVARARIRCESYLRRKGVLAVA